MSNYSDGNMNSYVGINVVSTEDYTLVLGTNKVDRKHLIVDYICGTIFFLFVIPIVFGNVLVLRAIRNDRRLRSATHVLIGSLAFADLVAGLLAIPTFSAGHHFNIGLDHNYYVCLLGYAFSHGPTSVSLLTLLAISVERYIAIHHALWHQTKVTAKKMIFIVIAMWLYAWTSIVSILFTTSKWNADTKLCNFADVSSSFYKGVMILHMVLVLIITTILHSLVARTANKHRKEMLTRNMHMSHSSRMDTDAKTARMLAMVLGIFYICWIPYLLTLPITLTLKDSGDPFWLHVWEQFGGIIVLSNSFMNPIVYAWQNRTFRNAFRKILGLYKGRDPSVRGSVSSRFLQSLTPLASRENSPMPSRAGSRRPSNNDLPTRNGSGTPKITRFSQAHV